ncbi:MarR family transcriptional regulator [Terrimonas sp. NA20]|uniref:MarR family transcriptional regulator n=1 Tax=Terrimonas ginsenosidimutans TaxID=2908004 RepID=A0ABS9KT64_9BACT|nr:MarR family transcriptional regulator [Terrimonas ginsenosidimutans]MCG2615518.1 MarR family transcriptional regulator [Terrimonas ginsenosidimutans]
MADRNLDDNIVYLISSFSHHFTRALAAAFQRSALPITPEQFAILMLLAQEDGINQQEISRRLERDKTTVTRMLTNLIEQGLVRTRKDAVDGRARIVHLTVTGRKLQEDAVSISASLYIQALEGVSGREIDQAISFLQRLNATLRQIR